MEAAYAVPRLRLCPSEVMIGAAWRLATQYWLELDAYTIRTPLLLRPMPSLGPNSPQTRIAYISRAGLVTARVAPYSHDVRKAR